MFENFIFFYPPSLLTEEEGQTLARDHDREQIDSGT